MKKLSKILTIFGLTVPSIMINNLWAEDHPALTTDYVNLRSGASVRYPVVKIVPQGSHINVDECYGSWCNVDFDNSKGWINSHYLTFEDNKNIYFRVGDKIIDYHPMQYRSHYQDPVIYNLHNSYKNFLGKIFHETSDRIRQYDNDSYHYEERNDPPIEPNQQDFRRDGVIEPGQNELHLGN